MVQYYVRHSSPLAGTMSHPVALADVTQHLTPAEHTAGALLQAKADALAASIAEHGFALLTGEVIPVRNSMLDDWAASSFG